MTKAIALFSGGLDSTLAILVLRKQGIEVTAFRFVTPFEPEYNTLSSADNLKALSHKFGFNIEFRGMTEDFIEIVKNPKHGYGKNMNPCIDCRILMLKEAKKIMHETGAAFIVTGEVPGQRPMSQKKDMLYHIDKEAGVTGYVLRPLCAGLLRTTIPEEKGLVERKLLYSFSGRSRKPQMTLARETGLYEYPAPAGGCLLTDPVYAAKLRDLLKYNPSSDSREIELLKTGRHFRLSPQCKMTAGRDEKENEIIQSLASDNDYLLDIEDYGSPLIVITGNVTHENIKTAASVCARYSGARNRSAVDVSVISEGKRQIITVAPASDEFINGIRI